MDTKISALPPAASLGATDIWPIVQAGVTDKITAQLAVNFMATSLAGHGLVASANVLNFAQAGNYTIGDLPYANAGTTITMLAGVATGNALISGGVATAPSWGKVGLTTHVSGVLPEANGGTNQSTYTQGDILYASAANTLSKLADVATGNALISGGVGAAPSYGKIGLTTHVSGTLPVANGGTGTATAFTQGSVVFAGAAGVFSQDNTNFFWDNTAKKLSIPLISLAAGTVTVSTPIVDTSQTWNAGGVTFTGLKLNITDTASAAGSMFADFQIGGSSRLNFSKTGAINMTGATITALEPALNITRTWNNAAVTFTSVLVNITDTASNAASLLMDLQVGADSKFKIDKGGSFKTVVNDKWTSHNGATDYPNTFFGVSGHLDQVSISANVFQCLNTSGNTVNLVVEASNVFSQRNSTNAQTFRGYASFTDASNYTRWALSAATGTPGNVTLAAESAGTGSANCNIILTPKGTGLIKISSGTTQLISTGGAAVIGTATLVGGTVTVNTTAATATCIILLTRKTSGGTIGTAITYTVNAGTSFTINSDNVLDTSSFVWRIVETF